MDTIDPGVTGRKALGDRPQDGSPLAPASAVCKHFNIVDRTLFRWLEDEKLDFPRPVIINGRRYFVPREVEDFEERQRALSQHGLGSARAVAAKETTKSVAEIAPKADTAPIRPRSDTAGKSQRRTTRRRRAA